MTSAAAAKAAGDFYAVTARLEAAPFQDFAAGPGFERSAKRDHAGQFRI